jgi:hypothetical protein
MHKLMESLQQTIRNGTPNGTPNGPGIIDGPITGIRCGMVTPTLKSCQPAFIVQFIQLMISG